MACNPQAYLTLDKSQYAPGESVRVSGSFFKNNTAITVSLDRTGQSSTVTTSGNGAFAVTFALPSSAATGGYSVTAIGYEANGDVINGLPARASFAVATAQTATPQASDEGASAPAASQPAASQPAAPAAQPAAPQASRPAARQPSGPASSGFREPLVVDEPDVQRSRTGQSSTRSSTSGSPASSSDRATSNGRAVFGGSVATVPSAATGAPLAATTTATRSASRSSAGTSADRSRGTSASRGVSPQAAEQAATDDVWGALSPGRSPSVLPVAGDGAAVSSPRAGSQLALGALLLGAGVLALIGGFAAGEVRRRRVRAH